MSDLKIAVLIPCFNEEQTITQVIRHAKQHLPQAQIVVCDNACTDNTALLAQQAGAQVIVEPNHGKGSAVRRLLAETEADFYVMTDGDATYDLSHAWQYIQQAHEQHIDFINVARQHTDHTAYRPGHQLGNKVLTGFVRFIFGDKIKDLLSGYKIFSNRFVKTFPAKSVGFEIETELCVFALSCRMPLLEKQDPYYPRPQGSASKLSTYRDGWRILQTIFLLIKEEKPLLFCMAMAALLAITAIILSIPILWTFWQTGLVPRLPTAVLATGLMIWALLFVIAGIILDNVRLFVQESRRRNYLLFSHPKDTK